MIRYSIDILGNSGCIVQLEKLEYKIVISKSTSNVNYILRLQEQIARQKQFRQTLPLDSFICVPEVLCEEFNSNYYKVYMEYMPYNDFIDFFSVSSLDKIQKAVNEICNFVKTNMNNTILVVMNSTIRSKLVELRKKIEIQLQCDIVKNKFFRIEKILDSKEIVLPIGPAHGDLTFSNILFSRNTCCVSLIDFLDGYIESPYLDVVKLRQDSQLFWSLRKTNKVFDNIRVKLILRWIDQYIINEFSIDEEIYALLQTINILRILPYSKEDDEIKFLKNCLLKLEF